MIDLAYAQKSPLALIVDDDMSQRMTMGAALMKAGFEVIGADNGFRGISMFRSQKPDLVLLDVVMSEMDGFEACSAIRELPEGLYAQILMVTGLGDTDSIRRAFEVGADGFVVKPVNLVMLGYQGRYMLRAGQAFKELYRSRTELAKTQELAKLGNWQVDLVTRKFHCSHEAGRLLGLNGKGSHITCDEFMETIIEPDREKVKEEMAKAVKLKKTLNLDYPVLLPDGSQKHILNQGEILFNENGDPELLLGVIQDVSRLKSAEEEIRLLAFYDGLTGLANRMLFMDRLKHSIARARRNNQIFALLYLDLDRFKRVNDTLGHHIGDVLLKNIAEILKKNIRTGDTASRPCSDKFDSIIARLGGDEFTILLTDIRDTESASAVARRLIEEIPDVHNCEGHRVSVTTSIGISLFPADGETADVLLKKADSAMYQAKDSGRNTYQFYDESLNRVAVEKFSLEKDIREALDKGGFVLHYQPQVRMATKEIVGAEALIRWVHPTKGMIMPDNFIRIAEESDLIIDINRWVLKRACSQCKEWAKDGLSAQKIAVNLSGNKLTRQNLFSNIQKVLSAEGMDGNSLEIEITEHALMQDSDNAVAILNQIKKLGVQITLDDFGTGYSSLSYLTSFPFDAIKIDRSFAMECTQNHDKLVIIKTIIAMGHSLGKKVVVEGIETEEQFDLLMQCGCDEAQGYYFSQPVIPEEFAGLLSRGRF